MVGLRATLVTVFSIGYIASYQRMYNTAFQSDGKRQIWQRCGLLCFSTGLGCFLHVGAVLVMRGDTALFYHSWSILMLLVPFLYSGFTKVEVVIQGLGFFTVWWAHHITNFTTYPTMIAFGITVVLIYGMKRFHLLMTRYWFMGFISFTAVGSLFWLTMPAKMMRIEITPDQRRLAVVLFTIMAGVVIEYWLRQYREAHDQKMLQQLSTYDRHGVQQRTLYEERLTTLFTQAQEMQTPLTLVALDFDRFKQVNERYGYLAGNSVLMGVTETIMTVLDQSGLKFELGKSIGEELNIVFPQSTSQTVLELMMTIRQAVRTREYNYAKRAIRVTLSIGITEMQANDSTIDSLYKRSDDAVYTSKRNGRDLITVENQVFGCQSETPVAYQNFCFFGQGIYTISNGHSQLDAYELLLRRYDEHQQRWVLPDDFELPVKELSRLVQQVLAEHPHQQLNLNLTARQFRDEEVAEALASLASYDQDLSQLTIEITELANLDVTRRVSAIYRAAGIKIMIDDVGSDNSFEVVRNELIFVDGIKFAMQNLRRTNTAAQMRERVEFWQQVAQETSCAFILEGVETSEDVALTDQFGITRVQAYFYDRPQVLRQEG